jgi:hypothetical protein
VPAYRLLFAPAFADTAGWMLQAHGPGAAIVFALSLYLTWHRSGPRALAWCQWVVFVTLVAECALDQYVYVYLHSSLIGRIYTDLSTFAAFGLSFTWLVLLVSYGTFLPHPGTAADAQRWWLALAGPPPSPA